jgi:ABC-type sugar transport system ATPase subunit
MRAITKRFPGVVALQGVDFELLPGEIHALVGENGSGKSTLCKCLYGLVKSDEGIIEVDGEPTVIDSPNRALQLGIVAITQELTLATTLTVTENILMGRLPKTRLGTIDWRESHRLAQKALDQIGADIEPGAIVGTLSVELQQEVEIARAISVQSRVLILDEATSSLSETATERLLAKMEQLRDSGVAIIFISHRLREVFQAASRATVLRDGRLVGTVNTAEVSESELVNKMVGRDMEDLYGKRNIPKGEVLLSVKNLSTVDGWVNDINFDLHRGEILGISGLVGSGKVHMGTALFGALPATGEVTLEGEPLKLGNPRAAIAAGLGFVPDDRKRSALLLTRAVRPNLSLPWLRTGRFTRFGFLQSAVEKSLVVKSVEQFAIRCPSLDFPVIQLSGGNQQKVILARWFAMQPKVVILAEPTRGIDVGAKSEIYGFMQDMAELGAGIIMISSEMPELLGVADRILTMYQGRLCGEFDPRESTEEDIAHAVCIGATREAGVTHA